HRVCKTLGRLVRQAIDEIHVDALESHTPGAEKQIARHFERLDAVNSFLHFGLKILNAHAQPVEAQLAEGLEMRARSDAGIDFYPDFTVRRELKTLARKLEKVFNLLRRKISWRAAAPVELHHGAILGNAAAHALRFALQHVQIRRRDSLIFLDHHVARAKQAETLAERDVHVQRNGRLRAFCFSKNSFQIPGTEAVLPAGRGRITSVARTGPIVFREKFFAHAQFAPHLLERWIGERHGDGLLSGLRRGTHFLEQGLLAGFHKELRVFDSRVREYPVT